MTTYQAPLQEIHFLLNDVFQIDRFSNLAGFADASSDIRTAVLSEAAKLSEEVLHPLNAVGDREGCSRHENGEVTTPTGFRDGFKRLGEGGWIGLSAPVEYGGQGLPIIFATAVGEVFASANMALEIYAGLSRGAVAALLSHGSDQQKRQFIPKMLSGEWSGTMNLTEPHCGTDLGLMRTKAVKQADGSYRITGSKIFISGGEHDLTENIIHLVLGRIDGAPAGIKGVSLFVVPKRLIDANGNPGERNGVSCGSIEHKMGIRGSATCVLNYDNAVGWLVGRENKGMEAMFVMMNEARLGVGLQALSQSEIAYQNAANYAKERLQGRALTGPQAPDKSADPIIVHPDVRRTLLSIRVFNEAARALILWTALKEDLARRTEDPDERESAEDYVALITPVIKGMMSDRGFANTVSAQQMFGGHGYMVETGVEQFVRDCRITMLYEGANGIQALDLVARKLPRDEARAIHSFFQDVNAFIDESAQSLALSPLIPPMRRSLRELEQATALLLQRLREQPNEAAAGSTDFMNLFGLVALGYMWLRIVKAAHERLAQSDRSSELATKPLMGRFFAEHLLPETSTFLARIQSGGETVMAVPAEAI
jgi:acyl-CoA dehydrogenase